jgi:hypothetical protein
MWQKSFAPLTTQNSFSPAMQTQSLATSPKDDPMQIDKTRFKPLTKQKKQFSIQPIFVYTVEIHVVHECPKKCGPHGR